MTTVSERIMVLKLLKNNSRISAESKTEPSRNHFISVATLVAIFVLINGSPL
jgi:hypothetical protein